MPRVRRRGHLYHGHGLTEEQREILMLGLTFSAIIGASSERPIWSLAEKRQAWRTHRRELLDDCEPGTRPAAFFEFELSIPGPLRVFDQLAALLKHGLIDPTEVFSIEATHQQLRADSNTSLQYYAESHEGIARVLHDEDAMTAAVREFDLNAAWHAWRGRLELAKTWSRRAAMMREALERVAHA